MSDVVRNSTDFSPRRLVDLRRERGLTQRALARAAGLSQALVAELERGKHPPSKQSKHKIAAALGIDPNALDGSQ